MIRAQFYETNGKLTGFRFSGHSGYAESGRDIACAAYSSAVQLAVNMLYRFDCHPQPDVRNDLIICTADRCDATDRILSTLRAHFESVLEDFPRTINITVSEV